MSFAVLGFGGEFRRPKAYKERFQLNSGSGCVCFARQSSRPVTRVEKCKECTNFEPTLRVSLTMAKDETESERWKCGSEQQLRRCVARFCVFESDQHNISASPPPGQEVQERGHQVASSHLEGCSSATHKRGLKDRVGFCVCARLLCDVRSKDIKKAVHKSTDEETSSRNGSGPTDCFEGARKFTGTRTHQAWECVEA